MKKIVAIIAIIAITILSGCVRYTGDGDVVTKIEEYTTNNKEGMCEYSSEHTRGVLYAPCTLYHVGDTIRVK